MRLQQRQARETGICPVRRELYSQCFGKLSMIAVSALNCRLYILMYTCIVNLTA